MTKHFDAELQAHQVSVVSLRRIALVARPPNIRSPMDAVLAASRDHREVYPATRPTNGNAAVSNPAPSITIAVSSAHVIVNF